MRIKSIAKPFEDLKHLGFLMILFKLGFPNTGAKRGFGGVALKSPSMQIFS